MRRFRGFPRMGAPRELSTFRLDENSKRIRLHSRWGEERTARGEGRDLFNPESDVKRDERDRN
jgi:hypothetical protein